MSILLIPCPGAVGKRDGLSIECAYFVLILFPNRQEAWSHRNRYFFDVFAIAHCFCGQREGQTESRRGEPASAPLDIAQGPAIEGLSRFLRRRPVAPALFL
jgi:hypothetical protein